MEELKLTMEWDKTFPKSNKVNHSKVTFGTLYGFTLAADLYVPKTAEGKIPAIAVCGPYGAVKEQSSGLYAQTLAERGFITLAFDPSFSGESSGYPRNTSSPDIYVEDYSAAIDYLISRDDVDSERIGILGICGWGGFALASAATDTRIKATVSVTSAITNTLSPKERLEFLRNINAARSIQAKTGKVDTIQTCPEVATDDMPLFAKDFISYYRSRGYHPRAINSGAGYPLTGNRGFYAFSCFDYAKEIESAVAVVHGDEAFTYSQGQELFGKLKGDNKHFISVPGARHTDLYDGGENKVIPYDEIENFYRVYLK